MAMLVITRGYLKSIGFSSFSQFFWGYHPTFLRPSRFFTPRLVPLDIALGYRPKKAAEVPKSPCS